MPAKKRPTNNYDDARNALSKQRDHHRERARQQLHPETRNVHFKFVDALAAVNNLIRFIAKHDPPFDT